MSRRIKITPEYDKKQKELLKLVKNKGILVKKMDVKDDFLIDRPPNDLYKRNLGAVEVYDLFNKKVKSVYVVYEDFDGSIKYYDYPQTQKTRSTGKFNIFKMKKKQTVQREIVFLVVFVHDKDNTQVVENYFHEEIIDGHDISTYGTLTYQILPILNKRYVNVKVLNIQKFRAGWVIKDEINDK